MELISREIWAGVNEAFSKLFTHADTAAPFSPAMDAKAEPGEPPLSHPASTAVASAVSAASESEARMAAGSLMAWRKTRPHKPRPWARPKHGRETRCAVRTMFRAR